MNVPTGLLVDLANERQAELRRNARTADQRALVRSARPPTLTARVVRLLTEQALATPRRPEIDLQAAVPSLTTAKEPS